MQQTQKTKICHLSSGHPLEIRIFYKECTSLMKAGYDVTVVALHHRNEILNKIKIQGLSKPQSLITRVTKTVWDVYRIAMQENAKIYHFHDPELIIVGLLLKLMGKAVIYDMHEDVPRQILAKEWIPGIFRKIVASCFERYENFAVRKFDAIVAATSHIGDRFLKQGIHVTNINNYPILNEFLNHDADSKLKKRAISYVGGIAKERGIYEIVEALSKDDVQLLLAGWFSSDKEKEKITSMPGWKNVVNYGRVNREEVKEILSQSKAGLAIFQPKPNHVNAQPNKLFEYMSAGIPVIASNFPLWKKIIEGTGCGLCVDPLNSEEIAAAIRWIIEHPAEAKRMGNNGRRAVEDRYNWSREEEKLLNLYESLLS